MTVLQTKMGLKITSYNALNSIQYFFSLILDAQRKLSVITNSPIWIPDSEATHCMICSIVEFTLLHRRVRLTAISDR